MSQPEAFLFLRIGSEPASGPLAAIRNAAILEGVELVDGPHEILDSDAHIVVHIRAAEVADIQRFKGVVQSIPQVQHVQDYEVRLM